MALEDTALLVSLADFYIFNKVCQMAITYMFVFDEIVSVYLYTYVYADLLLGGELHRVVSLLGAEKSN